MADTETKLEKSGKLDPDPSAYKFYVRAVAPSGEVIECCYLLSKLKVDASVLTPNALVRLSLSDTVGSVADTLFPENANG